MRSWETAGRWRATARRSQIALLTALANLTTFIKQHAANDSRDGEQPNLRTHVLAIAASRVLNIASKSFALSEGRRNRRWCTTALIIQVSGGIARDVSA